MYNLTKYLAWVAVAVSVVALVVAFSVQPGKTVVEKVREVVKSGERAGSLSGPTISSSFLEINGAEWHWQGLSFVNGTSTPVAIRAPAATSTLLHAACESITGTSTSLVAGLYKSQNADGSKADPTATTTAVSNELIFSGGNWTVAATTTAVEATAKQFAPNSYLVLGIKGIDLIAAQNLTGSCNATFVVN